MEKTPGNVNHVDTILKRFPGCCFLHVLRDPRDVYASWKKNGKYDLDTFINHALAIEADLGDRLGHDDARYREVSYEALVADPRAEMMAVMAFIGAPWEEAVAHNHKGKREYEKVLDLTGKVSTTLESLAKPIFTDSIGRWQELLTGGEVARIEAELAGYIEKTRRPGWVRGDA